MNPFRLLILLIFLVHGFVQSQTRIVVTDIPKNTPTDNPITSLVHSTIGIPPLQVFSRPRF